MLSNEDFAVVVATNDPSNYYFKCLSAIRSEKSGVGGCCVFPHSYTIQNYSINIEQKKEQYVLKGVDNFSHEHILRARMSKEYWHKIYGQ